MNISGIWKLRLVVTFLFILIVGYLYLIISSADIDFQAEDEFYYSLTTDEIETIQEIYRDYPVTGTDSSYELAGYLIYIVGGGLFILMIKVWTTDSIYQNGCEIIWDLDQIMIRLVRLGYVAIWYDEMRYDMK